MKNEKPIVFKVLLLIAIFVTSFVSIPKQETIVDGEGNENSGSTILQFEDDIVTMSIDHHNEFSKTSAVGMRMLQTRAIHSALETK